MYMGTSALAIAPAKSETAKLAGFMDMKTASSLQDVPKSDAVIMFLTSPSAFDISVNIEI